MKREYLSTARLSEPVRDDEFDEPFTCPVAGCGGDLRFTEMRYDPFYGCKVSHVTCECGFSEVNREADE